MNKVANDGLVADDAGVVLRLGGGGSRVPQLAQVRIAADIFDLLLLTEKLGQGHKIDGMTPIIESDDRLEDLLVGVLIEVLFANDLKDIADDAVVTQHTAKHRALGIAA